jgi:hypothetical protein
MEVTMTRDSLQLAYTNAALRLTLGQIKIVESGGVCTTPDMVRARACFLKLMEQSGDICTEVPFDTSVTTTGRQME